MSLCYYLAVHSVSQLAMTMMKCRHRLMKFTTKTVFDTYTGKTLSTNISPSENESSEEGKEKPSGIDILAKVNNDILITRHNE